MKLKILTAAMLLSTSLFGQKPLTLEVTVPGSPEFVEHYNSPARGQFAGKSDVFIKTDKDGFLVGSTVITRQQIAKILTNNLKPTFSYIAEWQDTENAWVCAQNGNLYLINLINSTLTDSITNIVSEDNLDIAPDFAHATFSVGSSLYIASRNGRHRVNSDSLPGVVYGKAVHR
ncbi:MAG: hypothetical protein J6T12_06880, partial [Salinivirgaceae bacterium]|nr:hypothetical protein [Salinivirgaceae bacterium]